MATTADEQDGYPVVHAFARFIQEQANDKGWRNRDLARDSGLSVQVCSNYLTDKREVVTRIPDRKTVAGFAKACGVSVEFMLGKAIESLDLGYSTGDFVNSVTAASNRELLTEIGNRLEEAGGEHADRSAQNSDDDPDQSGGQVVDFPTKPALPPVETKKASRQPGRPPSNKPTGE